ncbi:uncharacterized protein LOC111355215 [Spodoptera litura]|uniref:Uncharacterized protein LOC111355215 n=1 Tax=Spodoptera litura TaxID=69820 RepID=A0A9J7IR54_SPOLT|nr:uncharacterized protein LOC111355215 [Spodoptera litura]
MELNIFVLVVVFLSCVQFSALSESRDVSKILSRRKRYVAFPEGSSFSCAGCVTVGLIGQPAPSSSPGTFTFSLNWAIAYELPNVTEATIYFLQKKYYKRQHLQKRINRRELYGKLETILDNMGYSGRECILKTLCETTQRLVPHGDNVVEEMFRTLFTMPPAKVLPTEPLEHAIYDAAHRLGRIVNSCDRFKCPISLVDLIKGYYNAPAPKVDLGRNPWALFSSNFG